MRYSGFGRGVSHISGIEFEEGIMGFRETLSGLKILLCTEAVVCCGESVVFFTSVRGGGVQFIACEVFEDE